MMPALKPVFNEAAPRCLDALLTLEEGQEEHARRNGGPRWGTSYDEVAILTSLSNADALRALEDLAELGLAEYARVRTPDGDAGWGWFVRDREEARAYVEAAHASYAERQRQRERVSAALARPSIRARLSSLSATSVTSVPSR